MDRARLWVVVRREYLERVQTRWFVVGCLLGPVVISAMIFLPAWLALRNLGAAARPSSLVVIDATGAGLGERLQGMLTSAQLAAPSATMGARVPVEVRPVRASEIAAAESLATRAVVAKEVDGYLVLDASTLRGEHARYAGRRANAVAEMRLLEAALRQTTFAMRLAAAGLPAEVVDSLVRARLYLRSEPLSERARGTDASRRADVMFAGTVAFLLYMAIILYGQAVMRGVLEEKTTRVAEVVVSSVRPGTLLAGKVVGVGAVGLTQQIVWVAATMLIGARVAPMLDRMAELARGGAGAAAAPGAAVAARLSMPDVPATTLLLILTFFVLGYGLYSSIYAALGSTVNSEQEAQQALAPVLVVVISSALFIQPALLDPSGSLSRAASIFPFSAPIIMPLRMSLTPVPAWEMAAAIAGLALSLVGVIVVAARIYRVGLLMYGKRATLGELARWARQA